MMIRILRTRLLPFSLLIAGLLLAACQATPTPAPSPAPQTLTPAAATATPHHLPVAGDLDPDFGQGGILSTDALDHTFHALALQPDGKLIVAGRTTGNLQHVNDLAVVRYNPDGSLDDSFGSGGMAFRIMNGYGEARALALQTDGKIVVVGSGNSNRIWSWPEARWTVLALPGWWWSAMIRTACPTLHSGRRARHLLVSTAARWRQAWRSNAMARSW